MGVIRSPKNVCLISALCFKDENVKDSVWSQLVDTYGAIHQCSKTIAFTHTSYYDDEMGSGINKVYIAFKKFIDPAQLADIKIRTNEIEDQLSQQGRRTINIDPGYIEVAKLILASTKNFSHRIYIGKGIYGDVQLYWQNGEFQSNPWTYPDYKEKDIKSFF